MRWRLADSSPVGRRVVEIARPARLLAIEIALVADGKRQHAGRRVVAVLPQARGDDAAHGTFVFRGKLAVWPAKSGRGDLPGQVERHVVKKAGGEIGAAVGAVLPNTAVVHEAVLEKDLLACRDVNV